MIIVILVLSIVLTIIFAGIWGDNYDLDFIPIFPAIMSLISLIALIVLCINVSISTKLDDVLAMYQEENTRIEQEMSELVDNYMAYENDTLTKFKSESSITLVSLYSELKTDTLVQQQLDIYVQNNAKIKELKEKQIYRSVCKWWLYFGK